MCYAAGPMELLLALGVLLAMAGLLFASQATLGVALVGGACFCAVLARIAQAKRHHAARLPQIPVVAGETPPLGTQSSAPAP